MKRFFLGWVAGAVIFSMGACGTDTSDTDSANLEEQTFEANPDIIDRMGRPEITNFILSVPVINDQVSAKLAQLSGNGEAAAGFAWASGQHKPNYNVADSFRLTDEQRAAFQSDLRAGIDMWDEFDGAPQSDASRDRLAALLANDMLVVDPSRACGVNDETYFDLESSRANSCGGRTPNADIIDTAMQVLIAGGATPVETMGSDAIEDGIDSVPRPAVGTFPYLVGPNSPAPPAEPEDS
jgi:hypothetical protein